MSILEVRNLSFGYTNTELYNSVSFDLNLGEHACLVGQNGIGKSTFMKIISGILTPDSGTVTWLKGTSYAYLDQYLTVSKEEPIISYLRSAYNDLYKKEEDMNNIYLDLMNHPESEMDALLNRAESIREYLENNDFYNIDTDINNVIVGLGLNRIDLNKNMTTLSGGEKAKVFLAKLLLEKPNCILMDEPTNFLDKPHVEWLIDYLSSYKGTFLVISHDEEFLKGIAKIVFLLDSKEISRFKGDYNYYLKEKDLRKAQLIDSYNRQQEFIKKTEIYIQKNLARASTTKMAQSRRTMLSKLERIDRPTEQYKVKIHFPFYKELGDKALEINDLLVGYDKPLLPSFSYIMKHNERIEIIGKNGIGKSTLIKTLMKVIKPLGGSFNFSPSAIINYFSQEEDIDLNMYAPDYIRKTYPMMTNEECFALLAPLGIRGDLARKPLKELSGGELGRVRLSLLTLKKSNILILDEPTNHLDKLTKDALKEAIEEYKGPVILVSHEKGFADDLVDTRIEF